ncbi:hypothetical protein IA69_00500 [Massilia sp. JS1662]|nr:hypothetical protein [Massilia sp. JS1662]KGF83330.1 hypothetical protein IA69_00500 [Massilia sp. JS1662]
MTMLKSYNVAFVLALLLPLAHVGAVDAKPSSSSSFKSGFSSQRSSPSKPSYSSAKSSGTSFGSFSRRSAPPDAAPQPSKSSGGFGSFGRGTATPQKSDSALSQKLDRNTSEANALRTLDARRQAQADAARDTRPVPGYEQGRSAPTYAPPPVQQQQPPVVVRQDSGLGHVIAGAMIANASRGAHANNNGYPGGYAGGTAPAPAGGGTSFLGVFLTLCMLALIGWGLYFAWRRLRRGREAKKPNYSFERN